MKLIWSAKLWTVEKKNRWVGGGGMLERLLVDWAHRHYWNWNLFTSDLIPLQQAPPPPNW